MNTITNEERFILAIGDLVEVSGKELPKALYPYKDRVMDVSVIDNEVLYDVGGEAWFSREDLTFISALTPEEAPEFFRALAETLDDGGDGGDDEDDVF